MAAWRYEISLFNTPPTLEEKLEEKFSLGISTRTCHILSLYISRISQLCQIGQIIWFSVSIEFSGSAGGGGGVVVYQYNRKKFAKIPKNTQN